jgi:hypothetical protein
MTDELYLVWSNQHQRWWRSDRKRYTKNIAKADRYNWEEVVKISREHGVPVREDVAIRRRQ